ncbi:alpha-N-arabinofuranosidase [Novosphingobium umbonatum]|uniref:non-reducing end alpha-L-arabinofuranosidase n=1 Tax=Novosphingobium umbonatum TaxID=1908524 RepID=A0A3S2X344_9SPHN|nr:alpha-L-arabinofuranosidase C-terminal domain-containing protein [Novosphingobium umbonatum]RVU04506.1 alpha-N-arabinofuranosidase [Novosphingobium umbonatum]
MIRVLTRLLLGSALALANAPAAMAQEAATLHGESTGPTIDRRIFSQFAEHLGYGIYGGIWVGTDSKIPNIKGYRKDVVEALRALHVPLVRWPGGCFADEYHWRDGIGPRAKRPVKINTHWGGVTEPNTFGTHEFMDFAELIGAEAYISGNVGSSPAGEMEEWVQYITAPEGTLAQERARNGRKAPWKLPYFGIGNELWGCGGNMKADYAADVTRRYATFVKPAFGTKIQKIASGANGPDAHWTEVMMREAGKLIDGIGLHYYTLPGDWKAKGSATDFNETDYARTMAKTWKMEELLTKHAAVMDKYDPAKRVNLAVDEWGIWTDVEPGTNPGFLYQQNSLRDALLAGVNINLFIRHADRVRMTNIAQMVNVLQAMILTRDAQMVLTPTYHVFDMYRPFQDATSLPLDLPKIWYGRDEWVVPALHGAAARGKDGAVHVALVNVDPDKAQHLEIALSGVQASAVSGRVLTAARVQDVNDFADGVRVKPVAFNGAALRDGKLVVDLPAKALVVLELR